METGHETARNLRTRAGSQDTGLRNVRLSATSSPHASSSPSPPSPTSSATRPSGSGDDAVAAGLPDDDRPLRDGGTGARAYAEAVAVYLGFAMWTNAANYWSDDRYSDA